MEFYHEVSMRFKDLPRSYKLKRFKKSIEVPNITKTPGPFDGAQIDFKDILIKLAEREIKDNAEYYKDNKFLMVKVSGNGAKYSHTSSFCLLSFTIAWDDSSLNSLDVHTIAAIKARKSYETLQEGFGDAFNSINNLIHQPQIKVNGETYNIKIVFCADYKFLLLTMGMKVANSKNSCIWCTISDDNRHDMKLHASKCKKRTLASIKKNASKEQLGCKNTPLLNLEPEDIICDELHILLRVMGHLIQALINTTKSYDADEAHRLNLRGVKVTEGEMIQNLTKTISGCGVLFYVWEDKKEKELQWPSMLGPSKKSF